MLSSLAVRNTTTVLPIRAFRKQSASKVDYLFISCYLLKMMIWQLILITLRAACFSLYLKSTYGMKLKLKPDIPLDKRWLLITLWWNFLKNFANYMTISYIKNRARVISLKSVTISAINDVLESCAVSVSQDDPEN